MARRRDEVEELEFFEIKLAVRHAVPQLIAIAGPSFSGKTFGALLLASGLVDVGAKIGLIDTENGRGSVYADDPMIRKVLPQGFYIIELHPPFHPKRYIAANKALEQFGCELIITDSGSHAWEGEGGALDMKEEDKGWNKAKLWTKRYLMALRYSNVHQIVCLRAQEKTKVIGSGKDQQYISLGMMPVCEKTFTFDLGVLIYVEGEVEGRPATHLATPRKWPGGMNSLFNDWKPQLLTPEVGRRIRAWNESAEIESANDRLLREARAAAAQGTVPYQAFYAALPSDKKRWLVAGEHERLKKMAATADAERATNSDDSADEGAPIVLKAIPEQAADFPPHTKIRVGDRVLTNGEEMTGWSDVKEAVF